MLPPLPSPFPPPPLPPLPPALALREPEGATAGKGKYDEKMDPLMVTAIYGQGKAQTEARKALKAQGKKLPKSQS